MGKTRASALDRSKWAAVGAAVAVSLGAGGLAIADAAPPLGSSAFVPITPCRVLDTRAGAGGPRSTPLRAGETFVQQVTGTNGACTVPPDAVGIAFNVTIANGTAVSFLTVWPAGAVRPNTSNLNWIANQAPTPNKVDVKLSADGKVSIYNNAGTVDVLADVAGYYVSLSGGGSSKLLLDPGAFSTDGYPLTDFVYHNFVEGRLEGGPTPSCGITGADLPTGATITDVTAHVADNSPVAGSDVVLKLWRNPIGVESPELIFQAGTTGAPGDRTIGGTSIATPLIDSNQNSYYVTVCGLRSINFLYDVGITYSNP
jgi:hypothetical protein